MEYSYPLELDWSKDDIIIVMELYNAVEQAYEKGIQKEDFINKYWAFKEIVMSKSEEKQLDKQFKAISGYSIYQVVKASRDQDWIKIGGKDV